ncbi:YopX family protein [Dysgonomonas sp. Shenzhen-Wh21]|uniref:YopX family protein n=1 Tax=Dysgonomonas TaxID=156973 RepID=UPI00208FBA94|nr:YopX family protein [Dysgonomonas mossii]
MREIIFRGIDEDDKKSWLYGFYTQFLHQERGMISCITTIESNFSKVMGVIPESISQFSSFYDTSTKPNRIFDGDIIQRYYADDKPTYIIIDFQDGIFGYKSINKKHDYFLPITEYDIKTYNWRVVGDIYHDNIDKFIKKNKS